MNWLVEEGTTMGIGSDVVQNRQETVCMEALGMSVAVSYRRCWDARIVGKTRGCIR
jgi:hypothetical protein